MIYIKKFINVTIKISIFLILVGIIVIGSLYLYAYFSPKVVIKTNGKFNIYDNSESLIYQGSSAQEWVNIEDINDNMKNAIVSIEDKNFYEHQGFDYVRILKAIIANIKQRNFVQGASTISQQYIKNMYLSFEKTWKRKVEEALLTLDLEVHYSKNQILEGYLNTINFGQGNYGIADAANYYFNKKPENLSLEESCILAGIPKSPANYNPVSNYNNSIKRAKMVALTMKKNGIISEEEYSSLFKDKIEIYRKKDKNELKTLMYYQDAVLNELKNIESIPNSLIDSGGLKIYTSLDMDIQKDLETSIDENMKDDNMQVAAIYVNPEDGSVQALIGGKDYSFSQYNRATQAKRQVGSTIKPFLYYSALSNGLTMCSTFSSEKTTFNLANNKIYSPSNYNNIYANKEITMAAALAYSDNIFAVKTHLFLGEETLVDTMKLMGLKEKLSPIPSLALGTMEISMIDYIKAYNTLASGGIERDIHFIERIEDMNGNLLYNHKKENVMILNYNYVYILNEMLTNSYNSDYIDYNSPTAISLKGRLTRKYAIKTGTTDNDHWIVGYNPKALLMVWTGNDDNIEKNTGYSKITKNIWADSMEKTQVGEKEYWYDQPDNVIGVPLNPISGLYNNDTKTSMFYFVKGTEPQYYVNN